MLPEVIEPERQEGSSRRIVRLRPRLQGWLKVERPLLQREERLKYLLVEGDLNIPAKCSRDVRIISDHQRFTVE